MRKCEEGLTLISESNNFIFFVPCSDIQKSTSFLFSRAREININHASFFSPTFKLSTELSKKVVTQRKLSTPLFFPLKFSDNFVSFVPKLPCKILHIYPKPLNELPQNAVHRPKEIYGSSKMQYT